MKNFEPNLYGITYRYGGYLRICNYVVNEIINLIMLSKFVKYRCVYLKGVVNEAMEEWWSLMQSQLSALHYGLIRQLQRNQVSYVQMHTGTYQSTFHKFYT